MFSNDLTINALIIAALVVGAITFILGIGLFVMWVKYSLFKRDNSINATGGQLTQWIFNKNNVDAQITSSFFYSKYWNHNKRRNTYKLRPWTHNRKSIWTMMEASQQAYATVIRQKKTKTFWYAFRLPQLISFAGTLVGIGLIAWGITALKESGHGSINWSNASWGIYVKISIGLSVIMLASMYSQVWRAALLKKHVIPLIKDSGLNDYELKAIQRIFTWALLYAVANAILQTIRVITEILSSRNNNNN